MRGFLTIVLHPRRLLGLIAALAGTVLYVWFAAVRSVPGVRRRKAAARDARRQRVEQARGLMERRPAGEASVQDEL